MKITIIGLGLMGTSMAMALRKLNQQHKLMGIDVNDTHAQQTLRLGIIHEVGSLEKDLADADLIILAIPVDAMLHVLPDILNRMHDNAVVFDLGSVKQSIIKAVQHHPRRKRFVAAHPMAGSEKSGPAAGIENLFENKVCILCDTDASDTDALQMVKDIFLNIGSRIVNLPADAHDEQVAYVSHFSHIISYALALTVLDKQKDEKAIFDLAAGGFASTARLAKSSPEMWTPILLQNAENLQEICDVYINYLTEFKQVMASQNKDALYALISRATEIRRVLDGK
jgi:prephenate dehydrogenase